MTSLKITHSFLKALSLLAITSYAATSIPTEQDFHQYIEYLKINRNKEVEGIQKSDISPYVGLHLSETDLKIADELLNLKVDIPAECLNIIKGSEGKATLELVAEAHKDPNCIVDNLLIEKQVKESENNVFLLEGKTANLPHVYSGNYTSKSTLDLWGKNVRGWECPSSSMYTDLMYGIPDMMSAFKQKKGKYKAWDILSLIFAKSPPEMLTQIFSNFAPDAGVSDNFQKWMLYFAAVKQQNRAVNPFTDEPHRKQMTDLFLATPDFDIILFVNVVFHGLYTDKLAPLLRVEMPELSEALVDKITKNFPIPKPNIYSVLDSATDFTYRNRCAVKAIAATLCNQLKNFKETKVFVKIGRGHLKGLEFLLSKNLPGLKVTVRDNWKRFLDMDIENRIREANVIKSQL